MVGIYGSCSISKPLDSGSLQNLIGSSVLKGVATWEKEGDLGPVCWAFLEFLELSKTKKISEVKSKKLTVVSFWVSSLWSHLVFGKSKI